MRCITCSRTVKTHIGRSAILVAWRTIMRRSFFKLSVWTDKWQMSFNTKKCKVMHVGMTNQRSNYTLWKVRLWIQSTVKKT